MASGQNYIAILDEVCSNSSVRRNDDLEITIVAKFTVMAPLLDERARRLWAAAESVAIGYGGDALVSAATGLARETIRTGRWARRSESRPIAARKVDHLRA